MAVDGVEMFLIGPADYSSTAGFCGQWEGPGVAEQLLTIKDTIRSAGKHCGLISTSNENLVQRVEQGFRLPVLGVDTAYILRGLHGSLAAVSRDRMMRPELKVHAEVARVATLDRPPESYRPDRSQVMTAVGQGSTAEIGPGVKFEGLVGKFNTARNLTTGIVTMQPGSQLDYHTHTCSESVTLLAGSAAMEVEGRRYALGPFDNIVIPPGLPHAAFNLSSSEPAVLHAALGTSELSRELVENRVYAAGDAGRLDRHAGSRIRHAAADGRTVGAGLGNQLDRLFQFQPDSRGRNERGLHGVLSRRPAAGPRA